MTQELLNDIIDDVTLDTNYLYFITGRYFDIDEVVNKSNQLDSEYSYVYKPLGFNNFYDMFIYCRSNTETIYKGGNKDLGSLNRVKRKVMRNGKEIEMTVYESNGEDENNMNQKPKDEAQPRSAMGSRSVTNGGEDGKVNTKVLGNVISSLKQQGADTSNIKTTAPLFQSFEDNNGAMGLATYSYEEDYISLDAYTSIPGTSGTGIRAVMELIKLGIEQEKEVRVYPIQLPEAVEFLEYLGFKEKEEYFVLSKKDVQDFLGDNSDFI